MEGLISTIGAGLSCGIRSTTASRRPTPTCGAASPMPGASYIVANILGTRARTVSASSGPTGRARVFRMGCGATRMGKRGIVALDMRRM
jgi:hypothetical protein